MTHSPHIKEKLKSYISALFQQYSPDGKPQKKDIAVITMICLTMAGGIYSFINNAKREELGFAIKKAILYFFIMCAALCYLLLINWRNGKNLPGSTGNIRIDRNSKSSGNIF